MSFVPLFGYLVLSYIAFNNFNCTFLLRFSEAAFEALPRLFKTKFDSGVLDEILFLDLPRAYLKAPSGLLVLEYRKATQESIYENFRVVHEGKLQIIFRWDLKVLFFIL